MMGHITDNSSPTTRKLLLHHQIARFAALLVISGHMKERIHCKGTQMKEEVTQESHMTRRSFMDLLSLAALRVRYLGLEVGEATR